MPARLGELPLPRKSPRFLACRVAVRAFRTRRAVVGLSGGPDSLALTAAALAEGVAVHAVCVDHRLQPGSAAVATQAAITAETLGATAEVVTVDVPVGGSREAAARHARYTALHDAAGGAEIWVGHTLDDQAETLLLGALRGNPAGMVARAGQVVRPLLGVRRSDTVGACEELGLSAWQDPHNDDPGFRRVAVRHRVLPLLDELIGGDAAPALAQTAQRLAADDALLRQLAGGPTDDCGELAADPGPLRRRRIASWLLDQGLSVTAASVSAIEALVTDWRGQGGVAVGGGPDGRLEVVRLNGRLSLSSGAR